jgi:hypothetical protein
MFSPDNYPLATGTCAKGEYRLAEYLQYSDEQLVIIENNLWNCIVAIAGQRSPVQQFREHNYIGSGWEWSTFLDESRNVVIKIPAGVFDEVASPKYFQNVQVAYGLIQAYFPQEYIAQTTFLPENIMEQEYIEGENDFLISYLENDKEHLTHIARFLECCLNMLNKEQWLPDFGIQREDEGFRFKNVLFDQNNTPKIIDFTAYYDVFRMYPARTNAEVENKASRIQDFLVWIKEQL